MAGTAVAEVSEHDVATAPRALTVLCAGASLAAVVLTLVVTRHGVAVSPDSVVYLSTGANLVRGEGLTTFLGAPLVDFPPGVPFVFGIGDLFPASQLGFVRVLDAVIAGITVWWATRVIRRHTDGFAITATAAVALGLGTGVIAVSRGAWSEPLFDLVLFAWLVATVRVVATERWSTRGLVGLVLLAWSAFLLRYVGLVVVPVGVAALATRYRIDGLRSTVRRCAAFGVGALVVPVAWLIRNRIVAGTSIGDRPPSVDGLGATAHRFVTVIGDWIVPREAVDVPSGLRAGLGTVAAVVLVVAAGWTVWRRLAGGDRRPNARVALVGVSMSVCAALAVVLIVTQVRTAIDPIDSRLMAPLFVPAVLVAALCADEIRTALGPDRGHRRLVLGALGALVGFAALQTVGGIGYAIERGEEGRAFSRPSWRDSEVLAAVDRLPADTVIVTNAPHAVWALTDQRHVIESPISGAYRSDVQYPLAADPSEIVPCGEASFVWIERSAAFHHRPEPVGRRIDLDDERRFDDGTIWKVGPRPWC